MSSFKILAWLPAFALAAGIAHADGIASLAPPGECAQLDRELVTPPVDALPLGVAGAASDHFDPIDVAADLGIGLPALPLDPTESSVNDLIAIVGDTGPSIGPCDSPTDGCAGALIDALPEPDPPTLIELPPQPDRPPGFPLPGQGGGTP